MTEIPARIANTQSHKNELLWLGGVSFGFALIVIFLRVVYGNDLTKTHAMGHYYDQLTPILGVWFGILALLWVKQRKKLDIFEFPVWFALNVYLQVLVNVWLLARDVDSISPWVKVDLNRTVLKTLILFGAGITALWVGYVWSSLRLERQTASVSGTNERPRITMILLLWAGMLAINLLGTMAGFWGYLTNNPGFTFQNYLGFAAAVQEAATFILMYQFFKHPSFRWRIWFLVAISLSFGLGLVNGTKTAVYIFIYALAANYYATRHFPWRWVIVGSLAVFVTVPIVNGYRSILQSEYPAGATFPQRLKVFQDSFSLIVDQNRRVLFENTRDTLSRRQGSQFDTTAAIVAVHSKSLPFVGDQIAQITLEGLIPRILWPGKPIGHLGPYDQIRSTYLGLPEGVLGGGLVPPGQFGDAYRAGGWVFVAIYFFILGVLGGVLYHKGPNAGSLAMTAFYMVFLLDYLTYERDVASTMIKMVQFGLVLWFVLKYVMFERSKLTASAGSFAPKYLLR